MLILTEKPGVAGEFAKALSCSRKDGCYENADTCITWAVGHLLEQYKPEEYDAKWEKWNLETLPILPERQKYKPIADTAERLDAIKKCFAKWGNTGLLLATDAEREGELIGETILSYVGFTDYAHAKRFWVSEALTPDVIKKGIAEAKPLRDYDKYKNEGYARAAADWLIGMNLSRLVALKYNVSKMSVGRVQTALLAAIYTREAAIANFKKAWYRQLALKLSKDGAEFQLLLQREEGENVQNRFADNDPFVSQVETVCKGERTSALAEVEAKEKESPPPQLYNLTGLQKDASKKHGYSPAKTLEIAQSLYETHKCLSYPRTPSRVMGDDNVELIREKWRMLNDAYTTGGEEKYIDASNKRLFNTAQLRDHHALIPLAVCPQSASEEERNVYMLVLQRFFLQMFSPHRYESISVTATCAGYDFAGTGKRVIDEGWRKLAEKETEEAEEAVFPSLAAGETLPVAGVENMRKETKPAGHYTEASLLALMENPRKNTEETSDYAKLVGLGTPATRASIIKTLFDREYVTLDKKNIMITDKGKFLIASMKGEAHLARVTSIAETTAWEEQLADNPDAFLDGIKEYITETVPAVKEARVTAYQNERKTLGKCPLCGKDIYEGKMSFFCCGYKTPPGCTFAIWKERFGAIFTEADAAALLAGKKTRVKKCKNKEGKEYSAAFALKGGVIEPVFENRSQSRGGREK